MTNTQLHVLEQIKSALAKQDQELRMAPRPFRVIEPSPERWIAVHTTERGSKGLLRDERECVLWIGPRGKVIDITAHAGPVVAQWRNGTVEWRKGGRDTQPAASRASLSS